MRWFLACFLIGMCGGLAGAQVQPGAPLVRGFSAENYGAHPQNWGVAVSPVNGLVYAANNHGVLEFDGERWRLIALPEGGIARGVAVDARGRVWVGSRDAVYALEPDASGMLQPRLLSGALPPEQRALGDVFWVVPENEAEAGALFVSDSHVMRWDGKEFAVLDANGDAGRGIRLGRDVLITNRSGRVQWWRAGKLVPGTAQESQAWRGISKAVPAEAGSWLLYGSTGWGRWRDDAWEVAYARAPWLGEGDRINAVMRLAPDRIAVGTQRDGVYVTDDAGAVVEHWTKADGLPDNTVWGFARDAQGGLWLATNNGLARLAVESAWRVVGPGRGVQGAVWSVAWWQDALWAGSSEGLLEPQGPNYRLRADLPADVWALVPDGADLLAAGRGLTRLRPDGTTSGQAGVGYVGAAPPGERWLALGTPGGVEIYERDGAGWTVDPERNLGGGAVYSLANGGEWLWFARSRREVMRTRWDDKTTLESFGAEKGLPELPPKDRVRLATWEGQVFAARPDGLFRFDEIAETFVRADEIARLARAEISRIQVLADGALWAVIREQAVPHLVRIAREGSVTEFSLGELANVAWESFALDPGRRRLWFGGFGPLAALDLARAGAVPPPPIAQVRRVKVARGRLVDGGALASASAAGGRALQPEETALRFDYAAAFFAADEKGRSPLRYRARLVGLEAEWSEWTTETFREFTRLSPGDYAFEVQAASWAGSEGPVGRWEFHLPTPWWRTWWCVGLAMLSGLAGFGWVVRFVANRALKRRLERLEAQAAVQHERLRIARDMHDDIGSALGRLALLGKSGGAHPPDAVAQGERLREVADTAETLMRATRDIIWAVNPQNDTVTGLVDHLAQYVEETLALAGVRCRVEMPPELPETEIGAPRRHALLLAVKEAVNNLVKYAGANEATLAVRSGAEELSVELRDDGCGFALGAPARGSGMGLTGMRARLAQVGGRAEVRSSPGAGTVVELVLPLA